MENPSRPDGTEWRIQHIPPLIQYQTAKIDFRGQDKTDLQFIPFVDIMKRR
jgi:hypothetical protein